MNTTRPLNIAHLVFGLIFSGIATIWFIGNAADAEVGDQAVGLPVVLIGAGVIGLVAAVVSRRRTAAADLAERTAYAESTAAAGTTDTTETTTTDDTVVLDDTKDPS